MPSTFYALSNPVKIKEKHVYIVSPFAITAVNELL